MRWLELIHLRPSGAEAATARARVAEMRRELARAPGLAELHVYSQALDLSVHLVWHGAPGAGRTSLGIAVAESLRELGLVNHSIWKEEP